MSSESTTTDTTTRSRLSSKNTESEYDLCERSDTATDTSHSPSHAHADIAGITLPPSQTVDVSLEDRIAFDEKGVVVVENNPLSVVEDGVKRKVPPAPASAEHHPPLPPQSPAKAPLTHLPPPLSSAPGAVRTPIAPAAVVVYPQQHQLAEQAYTHRGHISPATQLPQAEIQPQHPFEDVRAQNAAQTSSPPLSPFGVKRSYTAPPPMGRWPPPPTITRSPCCKDCATSPTAHEGTAAEMGHVKVMSKGLEMKRQRRKRELEIALGLRERDGSGVNRREDGSRDEKEQEQEQGQDKDPKSGGSTGAEAASPKTPQGPITPKELARNPSPLRVTDSVDTELAPLLEGEELNTPVSPSGGIPGETSTVVSNDRARYARVTGNTKPSLGVTTPTSPARGIWICTPPARSPISPNISSSPVTTRVHEQAQRANSNISHTRDMSIQSDTSNEGNDGRGNPGPTLHRSESSSTFSSLTSSLRRNRPIVTRAMSTGRLATELDENGMVVCMSLHSERVLGPSSWRGGKGR